MCAGNAYFLPLDRGPKADEYGHQRRSTHRISALPVLHTRTRSASLCQTYSLIRSFLRLKTPRPDGPRTNLHATASPMVRVWGTPEYNTWHNEESRVGGEWEVAFRDMLVTQPTTREGALALIDCFLETKREMIGKDCLALLKRLSGFLRQAA